MKIFFYGCWILLFSVRAGAQDAVSSQTLSVRSPGNNLVVNVSAEKGAFTLGHGVSLKARSFSAAGFGSETATRVFTRVTPSPSSHPASHLTKAA